jgi:hypothetical protein
MRRLRLLWPHHQGIKRESIPKLYGEIRRGEFGEANYKLITVKSHSAPTPTQKLTVQIPSINVVRMTRLLQFVVSTGVILPVNAPQHMIANETDTFDVRDFIKV